MSGYAVTQVRVLRSEWSKLWSVRSTWYTLAGVVVLTAGLGVLVGATYQPGGDGPVDGVQLSLFGLNFAQLILPVLGILVTAGEWSTGMIRASMAAVPRRLPVLWAKAAVYGVVCFAVVLAVSFATFPASQALLSGTAAAASFSDPGVLRALVGGAVALALLGVLGLALGAVLRSIPAAIGFFVGVLMVLPGAAPLLPYHWVGTAVQYTPLAAAGPLMSAAHAAGDLSPVRALVVLVCWAAVGLAAAAVRLRRSDV